MADLLVYLGLFATAFGAATIMPMQSEAVLVCLLLSEKFSIFWLLVVASLGNVLGALANWLLGRGIERFRAKRWFPVGPTALDRAQLWYRRFGKWSLLASWLPIVGDPITVVSGLLREPLPTFLLLVSVAKVGRYLVLAAATTGLA
ncbi:MULTISPECIES: YqaA family protein [unclassified Rhizobium]|uniref:YqaA family protein n=1 Tax=unclassified Rhizobium TaxID=2613769 RepID=UPI0007EB5445|nr:MULTISPECIES: YqaA family protein [unclassified Rhizobium]ANK89282.1 SNARE associated domain-containing protein [Rhizobium sp. N731]ANL19534.1 SNARE associated domain-containing protein [Rhizobium sp. N1314]